MLPVQPGLVYIDCIALRSTGAPPHGTPERIGQTAKQARSPNTKTVDSFANVVILFAQNSDRNAAYAAFEARLDGAPGV
jgi:hypothetical protein